MNDQSRAHPPHQRHPIRFPEFVALMAMLMATVAFAVDAMLPALLDIGHELSPQDPTRSQLVITIFILGIGLGTVLAGPISDALGRRPVILGGLALYMAAAILAALAWDMDVLVIARFLQGLGAAAPRVVVQAMVRDQYKGRQMARVMSFTMTIFVLFPAFAPLVGAGLGALFGWRSIFWCFVLFGLLGGSWLMLRQPETLPRDARRPLRAGTLLSALREVLGNRSVVFIIVATTLSYSIMFLWLTNVSLLFADRYDRAVEFPFWFAAVALVAAPAAFLNGRLVVRLGMQRLAAFALSVQAGMALCALILFRSDLPLTAEFAVFMVFMFAHFFSVGLIFGNLNALALEPLGHVAGIATSVLGGFSAMGSAFLATPVARAYDGTGVPLASGALAFACLALVFLWLGMRAQQSS